MAARRGLRESWFWCTCWCNLQTICQFLNRVDKTGNMIKNVRHTFWQTLPSRLLRVWCRKKQSKWASLTKVSANRKCFQAKNKNKKHLCYSLSYWWKKAPHQPITKLYGKPYGLVPEEQGKVWEGRWRKSDSSSDRDRHSVRDSKFWELRDLWCIACLECIVSVLCSVWCSMFSVLWNSLFLFCESKQWGDIVEQAVSESEALPAFKCK